MLKGIRRFPFMFGYDSLVFHLSILITQVTPITFEMACYGFLWETEEQEVRTSCLRFFRSPLSFPD